MNLEGPKSAYNNAFHLLKYSFSRTFMVHPFISLSSLLKCHLLKQVVLLIIAHSPLRFIPYSTLVFFIAPQWLDSNIWLFKNFSLFLHSHFQSICTHMHTHMYASFMKARIFICLIYCCNPSLHNCTGNIAKLSKYSLNESVSKFVFWRFCKEIFMSSF